MDDNKRRVVNTLKIEDKRPASVGRIAQRGDIVKAHWKSIFGGVLSDADYFMIVAVPTGFTAVTLGEGLHMTSETFSSADAVMKRMTELYECEIIDPSRVTVVIE